MIFLLLLVKCELIIEFKPLRKLFVDVASLTVDEECCNRPIRVKETLTTGALIKDYADFVPSGTRVEIQNGNRYLYVDELEPDQLKLRETLDFDNGMESIDIRIRFVDLSDAEDVSDVYNIVIVILNMNDNDPFFYDQTNGSPSRPVKRIDLDAVPETVEDGAVIGRLYANDFDCSSVDNCELTFILEDNEWISIDEVTGDLIVKDGELFDYESNFENGRLPLQIRAYARDNGVKPGKLNFSTRKSLTKV